MPHAFTRNPAGTEDAGHAAMLAVVAGPYGPPESLRLETRPVPRPGPGEVLVRIRAATVSAADSRIRAGRFPRGFGLIARIAVGWTGPRNPVLGADMAGEIIAAGSGVTRWAAGDEVIAVSGAAGGSHAQFRLLPCKALMVRKPAALAWAQAAAMPFGGLTALHYLRDRLKLHPGETILIVGAAGAVGSAAVQLARHRGAVVTAVVSTPNVPLARALGADDIIDRRWADWSILERKWDVILDTTGTVTARMAAASLHPRGRLGLVAADLPQMLAAPFSLGPAIAAGVSPERQADLETLAALCVKGALKPHVSATFPLGEAARAQRIADSGHKTGNVVLMPHD